MSKRTLAGLANGAIGIVSRASVQISFIIVTLFATRTLSVAEFGVYAIASSLVILSRNLLYTGPFEYLLKAKEEARSSPACLAANGIISLLSAVLLFGFSFLAQPLFGTAEVGTLLLAMIPSIFLSAFAAWQEAHMFRAARLRPYYAITVIVEVASGAAAVVLLLRGVGAMALVYQLYIRALLLGVLYGISLRGPALQRPYLAETKAVLRWSWSRYAVVITTFGSNYGGDFILGIMLSPAATGLFRASNRVVTAVSDLFAQPLRTLAQAKIFGQAAAGKPADDSWLRMFTAIAFIGWSALAGLALVARDVAPLVLGEQWHSAGLIIAIFCFARASNIINSATTSLLVCYNRQAMVFLIQTAGAVAVVALSALAAPFGVYAVAAVNGAVMALVALVYLVNAYKVSRVPGDAIRDAVRAVLLPLLLTCAGTMAFRLLAGSLVPDPMLFLIGSILAGMIGWAIGVLLSRRQIVTAVLSLDFGRGGQATAEG